VPATKQFETGLKSIDLLARSPRVAGRLVRRRGRGKTVLIQELIRNIAKEHSGIPLSVVSANAPVKATICTGNDRVGRHREYRDGVRSNERAARVHVCVCALRADAGRILPRLREQGRAAVHRTTSSVSRRPARKCPRCSGVCQAPSVISHAGHGNGDLQERITSTKRGSITSVQAVYVPPTTSPTRAATTFTHLDGSIVLSRQIPNWASIPPSIRSPRPRAFSIAGGREEHYKVARGVQQVFAALQDLQDIIAILGMEELSEEDKLTVRGRARSSASCRSRTSWRTIYRHSRQVRGASANTVRSFARSSKASMMTVEQAFYMVGAVEEARAKSEKMKA